VHPVRLLLVTLKRGFVHDVEQTRPALAFVHVVLPDEVLLRVARDLRGGARLHEVPGDASPVTLFDERGEVGVRSASGAEAWRWRRSTAKKKSEKRSKSSVCRHILRGCVNNGSCQKEMETKERDAGSACRCHLVVVVQRSDGVTDWRRVRVVSVRVFHRDGLSGVGGCGSNRASRESHAQSARGGTTRARGKTAGRRAVRCCGKKVFPREKRARTLPSFCKPRRNSRCSSPVHGTPGLWEGLWVVSGVFRGETLVARSRAGAFRTRVARQL
jgi:hypothetical protein